MSDSTEYRRFLDSRESLVRSGAIAVSIVFVLWAALAPTPAGFTPAMQSVLAVFGFAIVLWLSKAVPYVVSSTVAVVLLYALGGVETFQAASSGFASSLVFFLLLLLLLGQSIAEVDLDELFASRLLSTRSRSPRPLRSLSIYLLTLSFVMPSAVARAVTFIPVVRQMSDTYDVGHDSDFERTAFLILGHVNPIASMSLMTGGGMAIITSELIQNEVQSITWVQWAVFMIPPVVILYALAAVTAERFYGANDEIEQAMGQRSSPLKGNQAGDVELNLDRDQRIVGAVMFGSVGLWIIGSFIGLPTIVPAALAVGLLALPGIRIITAADVPEVSWGILFVIGAMFSLLDAMEQTGALAYMVEAITSVVPFATLSHWQVIAILLALAVLIRVFFSTASAAILIVLPIILRFGGNFGVNRLYLALSVLLIVGSTTILPFNTTSVLLSFDRGPLSNRDVAVFGFVTMVYAIFVVVFAWNIYWPMIS
ncbi:sodium-dependent transporter [Halarchaeum acidiphilum MH1-52-1]|uniref:Sodium-dependent transporter n=1 Tax=Halarchaeum acidiphilum MH1-52-1 TaxID=1261545 RepID=U2YXK2_9EURY|nr:SLC13 family permease [Halarchaeum acidiphilum]GAD53522.1 sodium-dependent transporter [Halarchaeum acidiphilum MH1-52-1]